MSTERLRNVFPKRRQDVFAIKSWGYKDCYFYYDDTEKVLCFKGEKYPAFHKAKFKNAEKKLRDLMFIDISRLKPPHVNSAIPDYDFKFIPNIEFQREISANNLEFSIKVEDRYFRSHCQGAHDLVQEIHERIPDLVVWPKCHDDVQFIVGSAREFNAVIIPFGGGTNVTGAVNCPKDESRMIVSLDTTQMNKLLWLDEISLLACFEAGIAGQDLESILQEQGFTMGHEPDSIEFSTLGGWIATRSSGIKQHTYGNIEHIVIKIKAVTPIGIVDKGFVTPRVSMGPDIENLILGSEGTLGVITEVVVRIHKLPKVKQYGSIVFPDFSSGVRCLRECSRENCLPTSLRLLDNFHMKFGQAMTFHQSFFDDLKESIMINGLGMIFDLSSCCFSSFLIEGNNKETVEECHKAISTIARKYDGLNGLSSFGERAYFITFTVGYMKDLIIRAEALYDSLETSVTWGNCENCIESVTACYQEIIRKKCVIGKIAYRISQVYNEGVCIYFYFGVNKCDNQLEIFLEISSSLKDNVRRCGGSLSHHHGIGKRGKNIFADITPDTSKEILDSIKHKIDPKNTFAVGNLIFQQGTDVVKPKL